MDYIIREIQSAEYYLLEDFLYEAIYIPEGMSAPPKSIIKKPELQVYINGFGTEKDDTGLVAEADGRITGAVWARVMNDYGHIDDETPSLAISLLKDCRGLGIGTALLEEMLLKLKQRGYMQTSLAVQKANYAVRMYQKAGFLIVGESEDEYKMVCRL